MVPLPQCGCDCPVTLAEFRADYPEFDDQQRNPDNVVQYWLMVADLLLTCFWSTKKSRMCPPRSMRDIGMELFVAHNLALEMRARQQGALGGIPGTATGIVQANGVNGASVSYDTQAGIVTDAGHWNLTTYGTRFIWLANMVGAIPIQVGIGFPRPLIPPPGCTSPTHGPTSGEGWPGPPVWVPAWNNM
jgi:hypothetical protein